MAIITFIYRNNNSSIRYYGKYIGYVADNYEEGLDRELASIIYDILKDKLNIVNKNDLIIGILSVQRDQYEYFSEEESKVFDLLYCKWSNQDPEIYISGHKMK